MISKSSPVRGPQPALVVQSLSPRNATHNEVAAQMLIRAMYEIFVGVGLVGSGLFTCVDIDDGMNIIEYTGRRVPKAIFDATTKEGENDYTAAVPSEDMVIDPTIGGNNAMYVNHRCRPNSRLTEIGVGTKTIIVLKAIQRITAGAEVTIKYGYGSSKTSTVLICECSD